MQGTGWRRKEITMKRTVIECDICGDDIVCMDGVMEIRAVRHISLMTEYVRQRQIVHVCPFCQEKIRSLVLGDDKPVGNVADVISTGGNKHAE